MPGVGRRAAATIPEPVSDRVLRAERAHRPDGRGAVVGNSLRPARWNGPAARVAAHAVVRRDDPVVRAQWRSLRRLLSRRISRGTQPRVRSAARRLGRVHRVPRRRGHEPERHGHSGPVAGSAAACLLPGRSYFTLRPHARATVLARYKNGLAAAVVARYGAGRVGVVGPHPEADRSWYVGLPLHPVDSRDLGYDLVETTMRFP